MATLPLIDALAQAAFGRTPAETVPGTCVCHGKPCRPEDFRDDVSRREFAITGMCQIGQDEVFNDREEDEHSSRAKPQGPAVCYVCNAPATCYGRYEGHGPVQFGCDDHCGHGCEDGWCVQLAEEAGSPASGSPE